jgi:hypothetical protein
MPTNHPNIFTLPFGYLAPLLLLRTGERLESSLVNVQSEPLAGLLAAETFEPAAKHRANFPRRMIPEVFLGKPRTIRHGALPK